MACRFIWSLWRIELFDVVIGLSVINSQNVNLCLLVGVDFIDIEANVNVVYFMPVSAQSLASLFFRTTILSFNYCRNCLLITDSFQLMWWLSMSFHTSHLYAFNIFSLFHFWLLHTIYGHLVFNLFSCVDWMGCYWHLGRISDVNIEICLHRKLLTICLILNYQLLSL